MKSGSSGAGWIRIARAVMPTAATAGIVMPSVIVVWLTAAPAAAMECQAVPPRETAIVLNVDSAGAFCLPLDWADKSRLVTAS